MYLSNKTYMSIYNSTYEYKTHMDDGHLLIVLRLFSFVYFLIESLPNKQELNVNCFQFEPNSKSKYIELFIEYFKVA